VRIQPGTQPGKRSAGLEPARPEAVAWVQPEASLHPISPHPRALIKVGYRCNQRCVFCHSAPHRGHDLATPALLARIEEARRLGARMGVLSGGEPTIRPDLLALADHARSLGLQLGLVTNARMLAYPALCGQLLERGLGYVYQSLAGPDEASHDGAVRAAGAFGQSLRAMANLQGSPVERTVNVVVTRQSLPRLREFAPLLAPLGPLRLKFSLVEPEGAALDDFEGLVPPLPEAARAVTQALEAAARFPALRLAHDGFPACLLPGMEGLEAGLRADGFAWMAEAFEERFFPVDDRNRGFGEGCAECSLRRRCRGVFSTYLARRGARELAPLQRPVSNSFNLAPLGGPEPLRLSTCPIRAGLRPPPDPIRGCLLRRGRGRAQRLAVVGEDFSDRTLERALGDRGQVYEVRTRALTPDDFAGQLRRLVRAPGCRRCPRRPLCGGVLQPDARDGFGRARRELAGLLGQVRGRVLDVGCGQVPVQRAFARALRAGQLDYLGLDPDLPADAPELPGLPRRRAAFEACRLRAGRFDWVLALRSLDHLRSPAAALRRMARLLAPAGGRLLLAEDVVHGLVRSAARMARVAASSELRFEHRFNVELEEAEAWAAQAGLRSLLRRTPEQLGCTLWILMLERVGR